MNYKRIFAQNHPVFLTVVTNKRLPILIENIDLLRSSFKDVKKYHDFEIYAAVILPDHFHLIINPENIKKYPRIIFSIKYYFSKNLNIPIDAEISQSRLNKKEKGIWQKRYYEHTIRNEKDLYNHLDYIHFNPVKHGYVDNVKDWEYSSFHKFVKLKYYDINWGNFEDINNIKNLDYE